MGKLKWKSIAFGGLALAVGAVGIINLPTPIPTPVKKVAITTWEPKPEPLELADEREVLPDPRRYPTEVADAVLVPEPVPGPAEIAQKPLPVPASD